MKSGAYNFGRKLQHLCYCSSIKLCWFHSYCKSLINYSFHSLMLRTDPFWLQIFYLLFISLFGYLALKITHQRNEKAAAKDIDIFFTSVSAATVSSMSTLEMETFSDSQLLILIILILAGGEIFTSLLALQFHRFKLFILSKQPNFSLELASFSLPDLPKPEIDVESNEILLQSLGSNSDSLNLKLTAIRRLGFVGLGYFLVVQTCGYLLLIMLTSLVPSIRTLLAQKKINLRTFSVFTTVSSFANCGFLPTNENMVVFKKNSGLLLLLIPQTLLGNSFYGPSLRFVIWVLEKITKKEEYSYLLRNSREIGYTHLMPRVRCWFVVITAFGFIALQFVVFWCMEWNSPLMDGLNAYEKNVAVIFQVANTRHAGESVFDLSATSPAILVIFIVMMYLPPYTSYMPINEEEEVEIRRKNTNKKQKMVQSLLFSQLSYLVIFIILICVVEAEKIKNDPLNFNVFNITFEVISAYGNVGYSMGYSCERQIKAESSCKNEWIGFVGKWSNLGKFILILVMFFGKLKKFNNQGGQHWKLS